MKAYTEWEEQDFQTSSSHSALVLKRERIYFYPSEAFPIVDILGFKEF